LPLVIGSHLPPGGALNREGMSAALAAKAAGEVAALCGRDAVPILAGSEVGLPSRGRPIVTEAARAIVAEAMREDSQLPLFVTCGGGLTEIASAWLLEPRIAKRMTVVWIGGAEHDGRDPPPGSGSLEYNTSIDLLAAQVVFEDSDLQVWQVPRDVYRTAAVSRSELLARLAGAGQLGRYLFDRIGRIVELLEPLGVHLGETFILGDSPLVLLTALWSSFHPEPASSTWEDRPCPRMLPSGEYEERRDGRPLRVFSAIDNRLMLEDLFAKLSLHAAGG
jgi:hypothetical protein